MKDITIDISTLDYTKPVHHYAKFYGLSKNAMRNRFKKLGVYDKFVFTGKVNPSGMRSKLIKEKYEKNPKLCIRCKEKISYEKRNNQFCCSSCMATFIQKDGGNNKWSKEKRKKLSNTLKEGYLTGRILPSTKKKERVDIKCPICNLSFQVLESGKKRGRKFCSKRCSNKMDRTGIGGGYRPTAGRGKSGWYKGIFCNSSWELAWVIYALDHNIKFERNTRGFEYEFDGKSHKYYPDFRLEDGSYLEVKGWSWKKWEAKLKGFPYKLMVLYKEELKPIFDYVKTKYGNDFIKMYE